MTQYISFLNHSLDDSTEFMITYTSQPKVTIHCVKGTQNGNYLIVNANGELATAKNLGPGDENEFIQIYGTVGQSTIILERVGVSPAQLVAFNMAGLPEWTNSVSDPRALLEVGEFPIKPDDPKYAHSTEEKSGKVEDSIQLEPANVGVTE
jgi:hypothetical protein